MTADLFVTRPASYAGWAYYSWNVARLGGSRWFSTNWPMRSCGSSLTRADILSSHQVSQPPRLFAGFRQYLDPTGAPLVF